MRVIILCRLLNEHFLKIKRHYVCAPASPAQAGEGFLVLLSCERKTVCALIHSGIALMGANLDLVQRAIVLQIAVVGTLTNSTFNGLVRVAVHLYIPF